MHQRLLCRRSKRWCQRLHQCATRPLLQGESARSVPSRALMDLNSRWRCCAVGFQVKTQLMEEIKKIKVGMDPFCGSLGKDAFRHDVHVFDDCCSDLSGQSTTTHHGTFLGCSMCEPGGKRTHRFIEQPILLQDVMRGASALEGC